MSSKNKLYICGTPIGNLEDVTYRLIKILNKVDIIAAEDTRKTGKLLNHYDIKTKMISYHEHNAEKRVDQLLGYIQEGLDLALVSSAGMPGISDPGYEVIKEALNLGLEVVPIPGPTALISALVVSGLPTDRFVFEGFLPRQGKKRRQTLRQIKKEKRTIVVYESPYRVKKTLRDLENKIKGRKIALVRELTKMYEEKIYGTCPEILAQLEDREIKGEIVLVIEGRQQAEIETDWQDYDVVEHVKLLMKEGYTKKEAIKQVAAERGLSRNQVYEKAIAVSVNPEDY